MKSFILVLLCTFSFSCSSTGPTGSSSGQMGETTIFAPGGSWTKSVGSDTYQIDCDRSEMSLSDEPRSLELGLQVSLETDRERTVSPYTRYRCP